jgi:hypothetical protein
VLGTFEYQASVPSRISFVISSCVTEVPLAVESEQANDGVGCGRQHLAEG